jgi:hypothetical protein
MTEPPVPEPSEPPEPPYEPTGPDLDESPFETPVFEEVQRIRDPKVEQRRDD